MNVLITGATGMVGEGVMHVCLDHPNVDKVLVINRHSDGVQHPKLTEVIHKDFFDLSPIEDQLSGYDACFFCLGVSSVGMSEPEYYRLTYTLTMHIAETLSRLNSNMIFDYVSGAGTDSTEQGRSMWARVKGKTENDLRKLPFMKTYAFRPGFIMPIAGLSHTKGYYKYLTWLFPVGRALYPNGFCTLRELALSMIYVVKHSVEKEVIDGSDMIKISGNSLVRNTLHVVFWIVGMMSQFFLFSCDSDTNEYTISSENVAMLKNKYDAETINYFYETVFHEDYKKDKRESVNKWKTDPKIIIMGNATADEKRYVNEVIAEINDLNLSIKCSLGTAKDSSLIKVYFGNFTKMDVFLESDSLLESHIDTTKNAGIGQFDDDEGVISKANIGIFYGSKVTIQSMRKNLVWEEIIQSLGVIGDSYTYPSSLFFEKENPEKQFTKLDKNVLSLLYEPSVPVNFSRVRFERKFSDVLYTVNSKENIKRLLTRNPQDSSMGARIEDAFTKNELLKHPKEVHVSLHGEVLEKDLATVVKTIQSLNKLSSNLNLRLAGASGTESDHGIVLDFKNSKQQKAPVAVSNAFWRGNNCMFPKLIKNKVSLVYNGSKSSKTLRQKSIIEALYFSLVPLPPKYRNSGELFDSKEGIISFNKKYADLLKIVYSNEFIDGLRLDEFKRIKGTVTQMSSKSNVTVRR